MYEPTWMDAELAHFRDTVRRFILTELAPHEKRWSEQQHVDREVWYKAGAAGLLCPGVPGEYGGGGGNFLHESITFSEQNRQLAQGFGNSLHSGIVAHYLLNFGSESQKRRRLPRMATGELIGALAMTEPDTGSDLQSTRTQAVRDGDQYAINGAKTYITNGQLANLVLLVVKTNPELGARGLSIVVMETEAARGFRRGQALREVGLHAQDTSELFFDDMRVPCDNLLGQSEGQGFRQLMKELPRERLITATCSLASMERGIEETLAFVAQRKTFGNPLLSLQNTRFCLAECETKARLAGVFLDDCARRLLSGELDSTTAAMAKWWVTEACGEVIDTCVQLHGGAGYMLDYPIGQLYQNVRIHRILAGTNEIMKELIARSLEQRVG